MTSELPEPSDAHLSTSSALTSWSHWSLSMLAVPDLDERANSPWARFSSAELPERATETFGVHGGLERLGAISQAVGPDASNSPFEVHINWYRRAQGASHQVALSAAETGGANEVNSFVVRSPIPGNMVVAPDTTFAFQCGLVPLFQS